MKLIAALIFSCILIVSSTNFATAAGFQLTQIGTLDTTAGYTEWWYSSPNPTLTGTAAPGETVDIDIDGTVQSVVADTNGSWSAATTMAEGTHQITLTAPSGSYSFSLNITSTTPVDVSTPSAETLPVSGNTTTTVAMLIFGLALLGTGIKLAYAKS